jgi:site-specific recombinase XerD
MAALPVGVPAWVIRWVLSVFSGCCPERWFPISCLTVNRNAVWVASGPEQLPTAPGGILSAAARSRIARSVPVETQRAYAGDLKRFTAWCDEQGVAVLPTLPHTLASYVTSLADAGRAPSTIDRALWAILKAHKVAGLPPPDTEAARLIIHTAERDAADAGRRVGQATASTLRALRAMVAACDPDTLIGLRDRAILVLGFTSAARRSELVRLDVSDLTTVDDGLLVWIRMTKTGAGREVAITYGSRPETCPIRSVRAWTDRAGLTDGPVFRRIDRHRKLGAVATGRGDSDGRLTGQAVALIVARAAERAGLDGSWSGHSLRRGFATEARRAGNDIEVIGRHGGWKDGSRALYRYIQEGDRWNDNPLTKMAL